jgi:hypothetical protein
MSRPGSPGQPGWCPGQPGRRNGASAPDAAPDDMPRFPRPGQLSGEPDESALDLFLEGLSPPKARLELAGLPEMLADLSGPVEPGELALEAAVLARFRSRVRLGGASGAARTRPPHGARWRPAAPRPMLAAGLVVAAIGLGGTAAAYAGVLPGPLQDFAHRILDAPAAQPASGHHPSVVPGQRSGAASATSRSSQQSARSAAPGATAGHRTPGSAASPTRPAHQPGPEPSPRPTRPPQPTRLPQPTRPPQPGSPSSQPKPTTLASPALKPRRAHQPTAAQVITGKGSNNPISDTSATLRTRRPRKNVSRPTGPRGKHLTRQIEANSSPRT